jgi:hypothetical protein
MASPTDLIYDHLSIATSLLIVVVGKKTYSHIEVDFDNFFVSFRVELGQSPLLLHIHVPGYMYMYNTIVNQIHIHNSLLATSIRLIWFHTVCLLSLSQVSPFSNP